MDDVIEELRDCAETVPVALELPDMDQIVEAEEEILIGLPFEFKQFELHVSDLVIGSLEPVTIADPSSHTYLPEVTAQAWNDGLPREYIVLCQKDHNYYCVDEQGTVKFWCEGVITEQEWETVWHWARDVWMLS